jgi:hypothetical protein
MTQGFHKVKPRAYRAARAFKYNVHETVQPSIVVSLGVEKVSEIIKSVTKDNEDAFQDTWLAIVGDHVGSEEGIRRVADEIAHKYSSERITRIRRDISPDTVIHESHQSFHDVTIGDMLEAPKPRTDEEIDHDIDANTQYVAGKINHKGFVHLDWDTAKRLRELFPHDTFNVSIRKLVQLPPAERDKRPWYKWEDAIIRQRYPWGGARACSLDIFRSLNAINKRANLLGFSVNKLNSYKPFPDWLNITELAYKLGCSYTVAAQLEKSGKIQSIRLAKYHQGHDGVFFSPKAVEVYIQNEEKTKRLRQKVFDDSLERLTLGRYAVASMGRKTHYVVLTPENEVMAACCKWSRIPLETIKKCNYNPFVDGIPSCHNCLTFKRIQANIET